MAAFGTALALIAAARSQRWGSDEGMCANALVRQLLAMAGPLLVVSANSLSGWQLL